jgi:peptide-methionine (S)-S-oxide reductase
MTGKTYLAASLLIALLFTGIYAMSSTSPRDASSPPTPDPYPGEAPRPAQLAKATFGGGCFWCTEAVFQRLKGVESVVSGYSGGHVKNPTYREVCNGDTGHAEVIQITYDPQFVSFDELLEVFWKTHDPTTPNQQGNDYGPQYRSVVFYHDHQQRKVAEDYKEKLDASGAFRGPIVTEISPFTEFYAAEDYHQQYFNLNSDQMYCRMVIGPKLDKFRKVFKDKLKEGEE